MLRWPTSLPRKKWMKICDKWLLITCVYLRMIQYQEIVFTIQAYEIYSPNQWRNQLSKRVRRHIFSINLFGNWLIFSSSFLNIFYMQADVVTFIHKSTCWSGEQVYWTFAKSKFSRTFQWKWTETERINHVLLTMLSWLII